MLERVSTTVVTARTGRNRTNLVEKPFGWLKQIGPLKKVKLRGLAKVD
jgi:hypothetical protein